MIVIPDYIMAVWRKNNFIDKRGVTTKLLESLSGLKAIYSVIKKNKPK